MCQLSDNFYSAVRALAGDGSVKDRLANAYSENLEMLSEDDLPETIKPRFEGLRQAMHSAKPLSKESPVTASIRKMSPTEASRYATSIVAMFSELVRVKATGERLHETNGKERETKPAVEKVPPLLRSALN